MEHGTFAVDTAARRIRGILIPWGEMSRTSASKTKPITFPRGSVTIPRDPSVASLNVGHDRFSPLGRGAHFEDQDKGLYAEFDIADTEEGDQWLADHGDFVKLSAEVRDIERDENDHGRAKLTGAALVTEGAFASAALFAIDEVDAALKAAIDDDEDDEEDEETTDAAPADSDEEPDEEPDDTEGDTVSEFATIPAGKKPAPTKSALTRSGFINAMFSARTSGSTTALQPYMAFNEEAGLFELADITYNGVGGLNNNNQLTGPQYLGELWEATPDVRTFIPAVGTQALRALTATGWNIAVDPDAIATWAGNKTDIPTEEATAATLTFNAQRFAGGNDLAREYWDFNHTEVIDSWTRKMVQLYMKKSDAYALTQVVAGAATATPGTVPSGANAGMTAVIDLAMQVYAAGGTPNVIRVAPDLYRTMLLELDGNQFAYLGASLGLRDGDLAGLDIRPDARLAASQILVLDRNGVGVWELPSSPIRVDAVSIVNGGYDRAFFGYIAAGVIESPVVLKATLA